MGNGTHIPKEAAVDNSDTESMLTDEKEENGGRTEAETSQWDTLTRKY